MDVRFWKSPAHCTTLATNHTKGLHREIHLIPNLLLLMHTHVASQEAVSCAGVRETYPPRHAPPFMTLARGFPSESTVARQLI
jgi:hypothetical protein